MKGYNHVTLVGNLKENPVKVTNDGIREVKFTLNIERNSNSQNEIITEYIPIVYRDKFVSLCLDYLEKGKRVLVDGELRLNNNSIVVLGTELTMLSNHSK